KTLPGTVRRVLYIGPAADEVCAIVTQHVGEIDIRYESEVRAALAVARQMNFDTVIVDQRDENLATRLIVPLLSGIGYPVRLVVVSAFNDVAQYLAVPGVARVLTAPIREGQLLRVLGLQQKPKHFNDAVPAAVPATAAKKRRSPVQWFFDHFMGLISTAYKRMAFIFLACLFTAFLFYGVLIAFFLLSSGWGAPMTLEKGQEMVVKTEKDLTSLRVSLSETEQKYTQVQFDKRTAERDLADARVLVKYASGTIGKEIKTRQGKSGTLAKNAARLTKVRDALARQLNSGSMNEDLEKLYSKRLIDKKSFTAGALSVLEASQRLASVEADVDALQAQADESASSIAMLKDLKEALDKGGPITSLSSSSTDLMLLTKQAVDARAAEDLARARMASAALLERDLEASRKVLSSQVKQLQSTALARAIDKRIDVIFVPYANLKSFRPGTPLYSCTFTVFLCSQSGFAGDVLPGEVNSVHPFFGKPIRGVFVEAHAVGDLAATREIIHGSRAPFFF
ncbi:MAG: hypothetical protein U1E15_12345, partial [Hyphomicrobiales bacterium]